MRVTAIFDIGKTNKRFFLFDKNHQIVYQSQKIFEEIKDDDGDPCEDLSALTKWIFKTFKKWHLKRKYNIHTLNFSAYGASFVHIDSNGNPVAPLYNYLKPYPVDILAAFYEKYGPEKSFVHNTASPSLQMLNSGLQLFWLKYAKPDIYSKIHWSLHLPQYLSYLFTKVPISEYTSVGYHTALWNFSKQDYHDWVYSEQIDRILPHLVNSDGRVSKEIFKNNIEVGVGIHGRSAALFSYLCADEEPFILMSTGTVNISLNPSNQEELSDDDLEKDGLQFLKIDGYPFKAARLLLGQEYDRQVKKLNTHFKKRKNFHKTILFKKRIFKDLLQGGENHYHFKFISERRIQPKRTKFSVFKNYKTAYHQLMLELVKLQTISTNLTLGSGQVKKIYVSGRFASNLVFIKTLSHFYPQQKIITRDMTSSSALGAAFVLEQ